MLWLHPGSHVKDAPFFLTHLKPMYLHLSISVFLLPPVEVSVRKEKVEPVYSTDASNLKKYSVVIASLSVKLNAESLKSRMEAEGYPVILAQNEHGMYRVIVASYDDKESAIAKRDEIFRKYSALGDTEYLRKTYGIPFNDLWILERQY
jgi:hypothetical protein